MSTPGPETLPGILIVDDTPMNLRLLARMLTDNGYHTRPVLSGEQALAAAQTLPPDLILLDIRMPGMDGYEVCRRLKADASTRDIPILFISALSETEDKIRAFAAGGVDYVTKPFRLEEILARVQTHLTLRRLQESRQQELSVRDHMAADLRAYANTVADDLRAPAASALELAQRLESQGDQLPDDERHALERALVQSLRKMNSTINELQLLAEVRNTENPVSPVEMGPIVDEALRRVAPKAQAAGAQITSPQTWPSVLGYAPLLREVWVTYLDNAISTGGPPPIIELGANNATGESVRFWVRDNGPDLTPEQQAGLFTPFTQITQTSTAGGGLGLSIVQRIVTKFNGQVGVENLGVPGQGRLFYFTLPVAQPDDV